MTEGTQPAARPNDRTIGVYGITLVVAGAVLLVLAFTTLSWYRIDTTGTDSVGSLRFTFARLHDILRDNHAAPRSSRVYFGWLAWTLLLSLIAVGFVSNLPTRAAVVLRPIGLAIGAFGVSMTYYSFDKLNGGNHLDHARVGVWLAMIGFATGAIGAALGPMRANKPAAVAPGSPVPPSPPPSPDPGPAETKESATEREA
ncbi:MAG: hypothetical protein QOG80_580 [Pseudonocardiales bacterium]|nr:hypothetical protein [Pseudonocardiales bacterium]